MSIRDHLPHPPDCICCECEPEPTPEQKAALEIDYALWQHQRGEKDRQIAALTAERDALSQQLESDRTKVAECMTAALDAIDRRHWLTEGRGSYEWNGDRWHDEFRVAGVEIRKVLEPLAKIAANWAGCPMTGAEVARARIDVIAERDRLATELVEARSVAIAMAAKDLDSSAVARAERDRLRNALLAVEWGYGRYCPSCYQGAVTVWECDCGDRRPELPLGPCPKCGSGDARHRVTLKTAAHAPDCIVGLALEGTK